MHRCNSCGYCQKMKDGSYYCNDLDCEVDPYDAPTVAMVGGFRGITAAFKNGVFKDTNDNYSYNKQEYVTDANSTNRTTVNTNNPNTYNVPTNRSKVVPQKVVPGNNELTIIDFNNLDFNQRALNNKFGRDSANGRQDWSHRNTDLYDTSVIVDDTSARNLSQLRRGG